MKFGTTFAEECFPNLLFNGFSVVRKKSEGRRVNFAVINYDPDVIFLL
jgi:hypothetical protein